jgi:hypothetical protein
MTLEVLLVLAAFGVWIYGLCDVIQARDGGSRILTRAAWTPVVFFGFAPGALGWLVLGRPRAATQPADHDDLTADLDQESVEAFRARVRARAEEQRKRYAEQQRSLEEDSAP